MITIQVKNLIKPKIVENSQTTQYTATGVVSIVDLMVVTNTATSTVNLSINMVPSSGSPSPSNLKVDARPIGPKETYLVPLSGYVLEEGDFISTLASAAGSLNITVSGREILTTT